jgi:hypothetical protein
MATTAMGIDLMDREPWYIRGERELAARRKKKAERYVRVPLWWIEAAAKAAGSPATLVFIELLHRSWRASSATFAVPNGRLKTLGVSREIKRRVLADLERAGLISVDRSPRRSPTVTLIGL